MMLPPTMTLAVQRKINTYYSPEVYRWIEARAKALGLDKTDFVRCIVGKAYEKSTKEKAEGQQGPGEKGVKP